MRLYAIVLVAAVVGACGKAPEIDETNLSQSATQGEPFEFQIVAANSPTKFAATIPGSLSLAVDETAGKISGTPATSGTFAIDISASNAKGSDSAVLALTVGSSPHEVVVDKELLIIDPAVVQDPELVGPGKPWHFKTVLQRIAGSGVDLNAFIADWSNTWKSQQQVGQATAPPRPAVATVLANAIAQDKVKLIAVVNRVDLTRLQGNPTDLNPSKLGEGRFVYDVLGGTSGQLFTLIVEFGIPPSSDLKTALRSWAQRWHALGRPELGGPSDFTTAYKQELLALTLEFSATGRLNQLRTNEREIGPWDLREFHLDGGKLQPFRVAQTPDRNRFQNAADFSSWIVANSAAILAGTHEVPADRLGLDANSEAKWVFPPPSSPNPDFARAAFIVAFNTCGDCHRALTSMGATEFQHIRKFVANQRPILSPLMKGPITLLQPLPGGTLTHDEMNDRKRLLLAFAAETSPGVSALDAEDLADLLARRAKRVH